MSKVIRNIATQRVTCNSQPQTNLVVPPNVKDFGCCYVSTNIWAQRNGSFPVTIGSSGFGYKEIVPHGATPYASGVYAPQSRPVYAALGSSFLWHGRITANSTSYNYVAGKWNAAAINNIYAGQFYLMISNTGYIGVSLHVGSGQVALYTSIIAPIGTPFTVLLNFKTEGVDVITSVGRESISIAGIGNLGSATAGYGVTIGCPAYSNRGHRYARAGLVAWSAKTLPDSVVYNPWQIFSSQSTRHIPFDLVRGPTEPRQSYMLGTTAPEVSTAMPAAILKTPWTSQPQGVVPALCNGVKASSIFVPNASLYGALHSTHFIRAGAGGRELVMPFSPAQRVSAGHGNVSFSAEWTIVCVYRRNAEGIGWSRAFSAGGESVTSSVFGLAYGYAGDSFGQLSITVSGSNASSVTNYSPTDTDPVGVVSVQVFTCKGGVVTSWKNGWLKVAGAAANIGSVNAGQMYLGCQVAGPSGGFNILGLITLPYGLSDRDGRDLSANPWQIFAPQSKQIWVTT
jgi:hypothetical protein